MFEEPEEPPKKIIFTGLDNGGKSSIILALQRQIAKIATLTPTKMVERSSFEFLDYKIVKHDLGGQKKYLINYLRQPGKYFADTSVMIYVIDLQDFTRFEESLSYYSDVLEKLEEMELEPIIYIFFHKAERILLEGDPESEKFLEGEGKRRVDNLTKKIDEISGEKYQIEYKLTTIFDLWSIISAFSEIMLELYPQSILLDKTLQEFALAENLEAFLLLDAHSLTLGQYYRNKEAQEILQASTPYFLTLLDSWKPFKKQVDRKRMNVLLNNYNFLFLEIKESSSPLYFLAMGAEPLMIENFEPFSKTILGILEQ